MLTPYGLLYLLSYTIQDCQHRNGPTYNVLGDGPSHHSLIKKTVKARSYGGI